MTILIDQGLNVSVIYSAIDSKVVTTEVESVDGSEAGMDAGMYDESMVGVAAKDPLLSNWFFVIGISVASLVIGSLIGVLLAKKKIKKGIELYED